MGYVPETYRKWKQKNKEKLKKQEIERYHSVHGWIVIAHQSIRKRIRSKKHKYSNECCSFEEFEAFIKSNEAFSKTFNKWAANGFKKVDAPSVDRINHKEGYTINNIQIITYLDNKKKGHRETAAINGEPVVIIGDRGAHIYPSMTLASMEIFSTRSTVKAAVKRKGKCMDMEVFKIESL